MSDTESPTAETSPVLGTIEDVFYKTTEAEEPETEPTEADDVAIGDDPDTDKKPDQPEETEVEAEAETEESGDEDDESATEDDGAELVYLDLDGEEVDLEDVRKWRDGHMMQADYTRKTTEVAREREAVTAEREEVAAIKTNLIEVKAELEALVQEDEETDWDDLRATDPDGYIEQKEKADKRKQAVEKAKLQSAPQPLSKEELADEQALLFEKNPSWIDEKGNQTEAMANDSTLLAEYWKANGFTAEDVTGMVRARHVETCLKAAKFDELQEKSKVFTKKAKKATLVTKPKPKSRKVQKKPKTVEETFYKS